MALRKQVLSLYRRILKESNTWQALDPAQTEAERIYIRNEARTLFHKNKHITNEEDIQQHLREGQARLDLALHYRIPYPRPMNLPQTVLPPSVGKRAKMKRQKDILDKSKSIYVRSLYDKDS